MMREHLPQRGFLAGLILGALLFGVTIAIGIWVTVRIPVALNEPPVTYTNIHPFVPATVCAGDVLSFTAHITINRPGLLQTFWSVRDTQTGRNILGTQGETKARLHPTTAEFDDTVRFAVPAELPPGKYEHVRATASLNMDAQPAFVTIPFTVGDGCLMGAKGADK